MHSKPLVHSQEAKVDAAARVPAREEGTLNITAASRGSLGTKMLSDDQRNSVGNPTWKTATMKARALAKEQRSERRNALIREHKEINDQRIDVATEHMALWYVDAYEHLSALRPEDATEREVLEFTPQDKVNVGQQVDALRALGWKVGQVIGSPSTLKVFVILER